VEAKQISSKETMHEVKENLGPSAEPQYCEAKNAHRPWADCLQNQTEKNEIQIVVTGQQMGPEMLGVTHLKVQQNQILTRQGQWLERVIWVSYHLLS